MNKEINRHIADHGIVAMAFAIFSLFSISSFDGNMLMFFGVPMVGALVHARMNASKFAEAFLICVGVASILAYITSLFPRLGHASTLPLEIHNNRLMTLYLTIYLSWGFVVLPIHFFIGSLRARRRGEIAMLSPFTCYLGLVTVSLLWLAGILSLPSAIMRVGFWPIL